MKNHKPAKSSYFLHANYTKIEANFSDACHRRLSRIDQDEVFSLRFTFQCLCRAEMDNTIRCWLRNAHNVPVRWSTGDLIVHKYLPRR